MATKKALKTAKIKRESKSVKTKRTGAKTTRAKTGGKKGVEVLSSRLSYDGPLFQVYTDVVREPQGHKAVRDVIRHNGSVVILAVDSSRDARDPYIVMERQYRHAAGKYLWELPAGKIEAGEKHLAGAKRELLEETGYRAKRWKKLVRYFASPGFLGEWMEVFVAEGLTAGDAAPEDDEHIELRLVKLSELLRMVEAGKIEDGKTLISTMLYARHRARGKQPR